MPRTRVSPYKGQLIFNCVFAYQTTGLISIKKLLKCKTAKNSVESSTTHLIDDMT